MGEGKNLFEAVKSELERKLKIEQVKDGSKIEFRCSKFQEGNYGVIIKAMEVEAINKDKGSAIYSNSKLSKDSNVIFEFMDCASNHLKKKGYKCSVYLNGLSDDWKKENVTYSVA